LGITGTCESLQSNIALRAILLFGLPVVLQNPRISVTSRTKWPFFVTWSLLMAAGSQFKVDGLPNSNHFFLITRLRIEVM